MKILFHCSWELYQKPFSTVMFLAMDWIVQLTATSLFLLSTQILETSRSVKLLSRSVAIIATSSPSQGSSRQQSTSLEQVLFQGARVMSWMSATALILPVDSLKNILFMLFSISPQEAFHHLSLREALRLRWLSSQAAFNAREAQKSCPLSSEGVLFLKSHVGSILLEPLSATQGIHPPKPGYLVLKSSYVSTFLAMILMTSSTEQIICACWLFSMTLAKIPRWRDSLLLALNICLVPSRSYPLSQSTLWPSWVQPEEFSTPTWWINLASHVTTSLRNSF